MDSPFLWNPIAANNGQQQQSPFSGGSVAGGYSLGGGQMSAPWQTHGYQAPFGQAVPQGQYQQPQQYQPVDNSYQAQQPQGVPNIFHPPVTQPAPQTAGGTQQTNPFVYKQDVQPVQNGIPQPQATGPNIMYPGVNQPVPQGQPQTLSQLGQQFSPLMMYGGMGGGISF